MRPTAGVIGKSVVLVLAVSIIVLFFSDLSSIAATGSIFDKLILTTPVVLAIRVTLIFIALGIVGFIVTIFWKQIAIIKIGSSGIEFGKLNELYKNTEAEFEAKNAKLRELQGQIEVLKKERNQLREYIETLITTRETRKMSLGKNSR